MSVISAAVLFSWLFVPFVMYCRKIKESMECFAVKFNFLTHNIAQGKKQEPLALDVPAPSTNIQDAVIEGHTGKGKDMVRHSSAGQLMKQLEMGLSCRTVL